MKIHIANPFKKSNCHYMNMLTEALREAGHEVIEFENGDFSTAYLTIDKVIRRSPLFTITKKRGALLDFKERYRSFIGEQWLKSVKECRPDMVLVVNDSWISAEAVEAAKRNMRNTKLVCWIVDNPGEAAAEGLVNFLPHYDTIFVVDPGWMPLIRFFNKNVIYLPLATTEKCYQPTNQERDMDFSFVGSFLEKDSAGFLRAFIISQLPKNYNNVELYGPGLSYFQNIYPALKRFRCYDRRISVEKANELFNRSKVTATIYHPQVREGTSPRVFDAALTKTPQIIQYTSTMSELFPGVDVPTFLSVEEFKKHAEYYLDHPQEREDLAEAMYKIVKERHLFTHRVTTMLEALKR